MEAKHIYWTVCAGVFVVDALAAATTPWLDYTFNFTDSLPDTLYVIHKDREVKKGKLIVYHWHGNATYPASTAFIKHMAGMAGDTIKRAGSVFWVNDRYIDTAKPFSKAGAPLQPAQEGIIGAREYLVSTPNPSNLDSRYAPTGNIKQVEVIGRVYEIF